MAKALNIRDVPEDVIWQLRAAAANARMTLRQYVLNAIAEKLERDRS